MSSLNAFLHPEQTENREVLVSNRFKENGKPVPFVIRPITQQENEGLIKKYTKRDKKGNETFDRVAYNQELTAAAVVEPDLENTELRSAYGVLGVSKLLAKMLYVGEYGALLEAVYDISGLDKDINEDIDEAKN